MGLKQGLLETATKSVRMGPSLDTSLSQDFPVLVFRWQQPQECVNTSKPRAAGPACGAVTCTRLLSQIPL